MCVCIVSVSSTHFPFLSFVLCSDDRAPMGNDYGFDASKSTPEPAAPVIPKKGMQLGGKSKKMSMMDKLASEDNLAPLAPVSSNTSAMDMDVPVTAAEEVYPIVIILEEKVYLFLNIYVEFKSCLYYPSLCYYYFINYIITLSVFVDFCPFESGGSM